MKHKQQVTIHAKRAGKSASVAQELKVLRKVKGTKVTTVADYAQNQVAIVALHKGPPKKLSKQLTKRTKLTKEQLQRAKGQAPDGLASRYDTDGNQSLELTRRLAKAQKKARRFVLFSEQLGKIVYVAKSAEAFPLTFDIKEARTFIEGFDNAHEKTAYWDSYFYYRGGLQWLTKHI